MKHLFAIITIISSLIGAWILLDSLSTPTSQERATAAATAVAFAVIPYCLTRSLHLITEDTEHILQTLILEIRRTAYSHWLATPHPDRPQAQDDR